MNFIRAKKSLISFLSACLIIPLFGCASKEIPTTKQISYEGNIDEIAYTVTDEKTDFFKLEMESGDIILFQVYPECAPETVENFKDLVARNFYDGLIFHRVIKDFVIQTGDPTGTGSGGSGKTVKGEFKANKFNNTLEHRRGTLSMARAKNYDSASSQFFICHQDAPSLNGLYAAFGSVIAGMDTVDKIATTVTDTNDRPKENQKIASIRFIKLS